MSILSAKSVIGTIAAALFAVAIAASLPGNAEAYQCKTSYVQAESINKSLVKARASAKKFWTDNAKSAYGLAWSVWNIATAKSQNCSHTGGAYYCIYKAKPCLYVVP
jgi:hypothetical protein